jgi:hypothetical protein
MYSGLAAKTQSQRSGGLRAKASERLVIEGFGGFAADGLSF